MEHSQRELKSNFVSREVKHKESVVIVLPLCCPGCAETSHIVMLFLPHPCYLAVKIMAHFSGKHTRRQTFINPLLNQQFNRWTPNHIYTALNWGHSAQCFSSGSIRQNFPFVLLQFLALAISRLLYFFYSQISTTEANPWDGLEICQAIKTTGSFWARYLWKQTAVLVRYTICSLFVATRRKIYGNVLQCWYFSPF